MFVLVGVVGKGGVTHVALMNGWLSMHLSLVVVQRGHRVELGGASVHSAGEAR